MDFLNWQWWKQNGQVISLLGIVVPGVIFLLTKFILWWRNPAVEIDCVRGPSGILLWLHVYNSGAPTAVKSCRLIYEGVSYKPYRQRSSFSIAPLLPVAEPHEDLMSHSDIPSHETLKRWILFDTLPVSLPDPISFMLLVELRSRRRIRKRCKLRLPKINLMGVNLQTGEHVTAQQGT